MLTGRNRLISILEQCCNIQFYRYTPKTNKYRWLRNVEQYYTGRRRTVLLKHIPSTKKNMKEKITHAYHTLPGKLRSSGEILTATFEIADDTSDQLPLFHSLLAGISQKQILHNSGGKVQGLTTPKSPT